jgi:ketosteroid isomerase-like protein
MCARYSASSTVRLGTASIAVRANRSLIQRYCSLCSSALPPWFSGAVDSLWAGDLDGFTSIFAPDALYEIPFTPTGPVRLTGREGIDTFMRGLLDAGQLRYGSLTEVRAYETGDDLIVEAVARHHRSADGSRST